MFQSLKLKQFACCLWICSIAVAEAQETITDAGSVAATTKVKLTDVVKLTDEIKHRALPATEASIAFADIEGRKFTFINQDFVGTVVVFISTDCPVANSYQPELRKLANKFSASKLQMVMVHGNPQTTIEQARKHQQDYQVDWPVVLDADQRIAMMLKAKNIPEAFLLDANGTVLYRGRIDDQYAALGKKRPTPSEHNLSDAITAFLNGQPIPQKETKAVGCVIRYSEAASQSALQVTLPVTSPVQ